MIGSGGSLVIGLSAGDWNGGLVIGTGATDSNWSWGLEIWAGNWNSGLVIEPSDWNSGVMKFYALLIYKFSLCICCLLGSARPCFV